MRVTKDQWNGRQAWLVEGLTLKDRLYAKDGWRIIVGSEVIAIIPSPDGNQWQEVIIDARNEPEAMGYWRKLEKSPFKLAAAVQRDLNGRDEIVVHASY
jgi:hypothetical protein